MKTNQISTALPAVILGLGVHLVGCYSSEEAFVPSDGQVNSILHPLSLEVSFHSEVTTFGDSDHNTGVTWYPCFTATWDTGWDSGDKEAVPFQSIALGGSAARDSNGDGSSCHSIIGRDDVDFEVIAVDFEQGEVSWCSQTPAWRNAEADLLVNSGTLGRGRAPSNPGASVYQRDFMAAVTPVYDVNGQELTPSWSETCVPLIIEHMVTSQNGMNR